jgi:hypothetical protein
MKALWHFETRESSLGASLFARSLAKIFVKLCMRLIGQKSIIREAFAFFGSRVIFAKFSSSKPWELSMNRLFRAAVTSS